MRLPPPKLPPANSLVIGSQFAMFGPRVPPGTYTVKLIQDDKTYSSQVEIVPDPRSSHSAEDRAVQYETAMHALRHARAPHLCRRHGEGPRGRGPAARRGLPEGDRLRQQLDSLGGRWRPSGATLVATSPGGWLSGEEQLREKMAKVYGGINGYDGRPTKSQLDQMKVLGDQLAKAEARLEALQRGEVAAANRELEKRKLEPLKAKSREEWEKEDGKRTAALPAFLPFSMLPLAPMMERR